MKAFLPLGVLFFALANTGISQITITTADMPQPGDTLRYSTATDSTGLPAPSLTGAGITWDFSGLVDTSQSLYNFMPITSTPLAYQFYFNNAILYPAYQATVALNGAAVPAGGGVTITSVIDYYKNQSTNYESVGYGATINSIPTSVKDDTIDVVYNFPMNYTNADSCHSSSNASIPGLGYYLQTQYRVNHVEGWGTVKTPYGSFSALKVKTLIYSTDSIYVTSFGLGFKIPQPLQTQYKWLANGQHIPVLQINETAGSNNKQYLYRDSARRGLLAVSDVKSPVSNVALYPNPAKENTSVSYSLSNSSVVTVAIYSVDGKCVSKVFNGTQSTGNHILTIDVTKLQAGVYFMVLDANGAQTVKKLVVAK